MGINDIKIIPILYHPSYIAYRLPVDCLLIALDAHMFRHNGYGPVTEDQGPRICGPEPGGDSSLGLGPGPISSLNMHASRAINRQSTAI